MARGPEGVQSPAGGVHQQRALGWCDLGHGKEANACSRLSAISIWVSFKEAGWSRTCL